MKFRAVISIALAACLTLAGCATTNRDGTPLTVNQRIARCGMMVGVGALVGAVAGNNMGNGNAGTGAAIGAAVGLGACSVWLAYQSEQDQTRIQQLQMAAVQTGQPQTQQWQGADGRPRMVTVTPSTETNVQAQDGATQLCRTANVRAEFNGQADNIAEVWCRGADGNYAPQHAA